MKIKIKREIGEYWKEYEGSKVIWKIKGPTVIGYCRTKKEAMAWSDLLKKEYGRG